VRYLFLYKKKKTITCSLEIYEPSLLETLSCGFMTSGSSGGVDKGAITTGSNSPSTIKNKKSVSILQPWRIPMYDH